MSTRPRRTKNRTTHLSPINADPEGDMSPRKRKRRRSKNQPSAKRTKTAEDCVDEMPVLEPPPPITKVAPPKKIPKLTKGNPNCLYLVKEPSETLLGPGENEKKVKPLVLAVVPQLKSTPPPPPSILVQEEEFPDDSIVGCLELDNGGACFGCYRMIVASEQYKSCSCGRTFHMDCLESVPKGAFRCKECTDSEHLCFVCGAVDASVAIKCKETKCIKRYHSSCLEKYRAGDNSPAKQSTTNARCPSHQCYTCLANRKDTEAQTGRLLYCMRCPVSYHMCDDCIPAGCDLVNKVWLVCPNHFEPKEAASKAPFHHNVDNCFDCLNAGVLVCCDRCPAAFHESCLPEPPGEHFLCNDCRVGKSPMYNDLVWVKYGAYRWWPSKVCHPLEIPDNLDNRDHSPGEFVVKFLGSGDYAWVGQGRVFAFCEGDDIEGKQKFTGTSKSTNKSYLKALKEAKQLIADKRQKKLVKDEESAVTTANSTPKFKILDTNRELNKLSRRTLSTDEYPVCTCTREFPCTSDYKCTNRAMQIECRPDLCNCGDKCQNQRFRKQIYVEAKEFRTNSRGWGLRALESIEQGSFCFEYMGELINQEEFRRRWKEKTVNEDKEFYFISLDKNRILDAGPSGNRSRFINHSCDPNCNSFIWQVGDDIRIGLFASRTIEAGQELTFHYNFDSLDAEMKLPCNCGAGNCLGYIGKRQQRSVASGTESKSGRKSKNAKRKRRFEKFCFRCMDGGELLCCDRKTCTRVYHLDCIGETEVPKGVWYCPWHYCNFCDKAATKLCVKCDNSWCDKCSEDQITESEEGWMCYEHKGDNED